jgi:hypothetical protein
MIYECWRADPVDGITGREDQKRDEEKCGEVGTSFPPGDSEPVYTQPCALSPDHDEDHDWAQRESAIYAEGYRAGREDAAPEIQKLRADVAELNTELSVAERDHCGCLGTTLCAYREEDQPAGPGVQPIEEQRARAEDQNRNEEQL